MIYYAETNLNTEAKQAENSPGETISCPAIVDSLVMVFPRGIRASLYSPLQLRIHSSSNTT